MDGYGSASMWGELRRVLVRRPLAEDAVAWEAYGWRAAPDVAAAQAEHEAFCSHLADAGAEVVVSEHDPGNPDAIYTYDPTLVGRDGAVLLLPGKEGRRTEPDATVATFEAAGVPVVGRVDLPATVEGGDTVWLDGETLLVGIGYRTNPAGVEALRAAFLGVEVISFDLPHWNGAGEMMHLMSFISPLDRDLAERHALHAELRRMAEDVAEHLRRNGLSARTVTTKLRYSDFSIRSRSTTLPTPIDEPERIGELACGLLDRGLRDRPGALRLVGVGVSGLTGARQLSLGEL